jgi:hypothetical protein
MKIFFACIFCVALLSVTVGAAPKTVPGQVLVQMYSALPNMPTSSVVQAAGVRQDKRPTFFKKHRIKTMRKLRSSEGFSSIQKQGIKPRKRYRYVLNVEDGRTVTETIQTLKQEAEVEVAQPNFIYKISLTPNDPRFSEQYAPSMVHLPEAWNVCTGNKSTIIAVIDTGVQITHPDLVNQIWTNTAEIPGNGIDNDNNGFIDDIHGWNFYNDDANPSDGNGHGTHVAGIVSAQANNGAGVAGTGFNCTIMPLRAGSANGEFWSDTLASAIDYARENGAKVINMSLGGEMGGDLLFATAVANAIAADIVVVAAAGNNSEDIDVNQIAPACLPNVIAVSAARESGVFDTRYSNFGASISLCAPGTHILSTVPTNDYELLSGTSMASPCVAGIAGLIRSAYPSATRSQVYSILTKSATDLGDVGRDTFYGYGMANAYKALLFFNSSGPSITHTPLTSPQNLNASLVISATVTDNVAVSTVSVYVREYRDITPLTAWRSIVMSNTGSTYTASIINTVPSTNVLRYYIEALDGKPNTTFSPSQGSSSPNVISLLDTAAPVITAFSSNNGTLSNLKYTLTDNVAVATASISVDLTVGSTTTSYPYGSSMWAYSNSVLTLYTFLLPLSAQGDFSIKITAKDVSNLTTTQNFTYTRSAFEFFGPQGPGSPILNVPNPFNPDLESTKISFQLSQDASMDIGIYTLDLRLVKRIQQSLTYGYQQITWDGRDDGGVKVANGMYVVLLRATANGQTLVRKLKIAAIK